MPLIARRSVAICIALTSVTGCTFSLFVPSKSITILSYNVQNLFDDRANGLEYEEFDPNRSDWSTAEYYQRLESVSRIIRDATRGGPDVVALQEIEHLGVLEDLHDRFLAGLGYRYTSAIESDDSPIVVGVISRFPIVAARSHSTHTELGRRIRPMLEVRLNAHGKPLTLFICHWKSKSGGARETEPLRIAQAEALADALRLRMAESPDLDIVVVGDLNESPDEYSRVRGAYPTALLESYNSEYFTGGLLIAGLPDGFIAGPETQDGRPEPLLYSPWSTSTSVGSYYFRGIWQRIDHTLLSATLFDNHAHSFEQFEVIERPYLLNADGAPLKYFPMSGTGFSDHLPLLLTLATS